MQPREKGMQISITPQLRALITRKRNQLEKRYRPGIVTGILGRMISKGILPEAARELIALKPSIAKEEREKREYFADLSPLENRRLQISLSKGRSVNQFYYTESLKRKAVKRRARKALIHMRRIP